MGRPEAPGAGGNGWVTVVVAHPDDEALWLSSVVAAARRVVFCFGAPFDNPKRAAARRRAVAELPVSGLIDLAIPESGARFAADWRRPRLSQTGIAITDPAARARYDANYACLLAALRPVLAGSRTVYTHNPWGEYGHAEHIQVHRAVIALQAELGYAVWVSNYVAERSWTLARRLAAEPRWSAVRAARPDRALARTLMRVYRRHGAWTWTRWHRWPATETLHAMARPDGPNRMLAGDVLLDVAGLRWWPPPWRAARRPLPARVLTSGANPASLPI